MLKLTIYGEPASKKNSSQIIRIGDRLSLIPSKRYRTYEREVMLTLPPEARQHISTPVNVKAIYYRQTRRRVDISNLHSALHDTLVAAGVLEDDNRDIVAATDGSRVYWDKDNPRTEVEITPLQDTDYMLFAKGGSKRAAKKRTGKPGVLPAQPRSHAGAAKGKAGRAKGRRAVPKLRIP